MVVFLVLICFGFVFFLLREKKDHEVEGEGGEEGGEGDAIKTHWMLKGQ